MGRDLGQIAVQDLAQGVQRVGADVLVLPQSVELPRADPVLPDQFVLRDSSLFQRFPQFVVDDHDIPTVVPLVSSVYSLII